MYKLKCTKKLIQALGNKTSFKTIYLYDMITYYHNEFIYYLNILDMYHDDVILVHDKLYDIYHEAVITKSVSTNILALSKIKMDRDTDKLISSILLTKPIEYNPINNYLLASNMDDTITYVSTKPISLYDKLPDIFNLEGISFIKKEAALNTKFITRLQRRLLFGGNTKSNIVIYFNHYIIIDKFIYHYFVKCNDNVTTSDLHFYFDRSYLKELSNEELLYCIMGKDMIRKNTIIPRYMNIPDTEDNIINECSSELSNREDIDNESRILLKEYYGDLESLEIIAEEIYKTY